MTESRPWLSLLLAVVMVVPAPSLLGGVAALPGDAPCGASQDCCCGSSDVGAAWDRGVECPCVTPAPAQPETPAVPPAPATVSVGDDSLGARQPVLLPRPAAPGPLTADRPCERPRPSARLVLGIRLL